MASPGNSNQPGGAPFDMHKLFRPSTTNPNSQNLNPANLTTQPPPSFPPSSSYPPPSSASYPPPTGPYPYPPPPSSPFHHQYQLPPYPQQQDHLANLHHQRSLPYPTPTLQPPTPHQFAPQTSSPGPNPNPNPNTNPGARLMALLSAPPSTLEIPQQPAMPVAPLQPSNSRGSDFSTPPSVPIMPLGMNVNSGGMAHSAPMRMPSSKLPKGRHLIGDHVVYDIDVRLPGEVQPQLEVTPITRYTSDPGLVVGRQIAVNKTYICYGLKLGAIRVLNINTALRSLLKGLSQVRYRLQFLVGFLFNC